MALQATMDFRMLCFPTSIAIAITNAIPKNIPINKIQFAKIDFNISLKSNPNTTARMVMIPRTITVRLIFNGCFSI